MGSKIAKSEGKILLSETPNPRLPKAKIFLRKGCLNSPKIALRKGYFSNAGNFLVNSLIYRSPKSPKIAIFCNFSSILSKKFSENITFRQNISKPQQSNESIFSNPYIKAGKKASDSEILGDSQALIFTSGFSLIIPLG